MKIIRFSSLLLLAAVMSCTRDNSSGTSTSPDTAQPAAPAAPAPAPSPAPAPARQPVSPPAPAPPPTAPRTPAPAPSPAANDTASDRPSSVRAPQSDEGTRLQTVPAGTSLTIVMSDEVSSSKSKEGDEFRGALADALVVDGRVVAERGANVVGRVDEIIAPGKVKGRAQLTLVLTNLSASGREYKIKTEPFKAIAVDNKERDAAIIAGGAGVGAAIGAITKGKKGAAIGAILGGGGGTAAVLATPGQSMKIDPETKVNFVLNDSVRLPVIRDRSS